MDKKQLEDLYIEASKNKIKVISIETAMQEINKAESPTLIVFPTQVRDFLFEK